MSFKLVNTRAFGDVRSNGFLTIAKQLINAYDGHFVVEPVGYLVI
jgi:hypothetical protein